MKKLDLLGDNAVSVGRSPDSCMPPRAPPCTAQGPCESRSAQPLPRALRLQSCSPALWRSREIPFFLSVPDSSSSEASGPVFSVSEPLSVLKFFCLLGGAGGWGSLGCVQFSSVTQAYLT